MGPETGTEGSNPQMEAIAKMQEQMAIMLAMIQAMQGAQTPAQVNPNMGLDGSMPIPTQMQTSFFGAGTGAVQYYARLEGPPKFKEASSYKSYRRRLDNWLSNTQVTKSKQGNLVANALCDNNKIKLHLQKRLFDNISDVDLPGARTRSRQAPRPHRSLGQH